MPAILSDLPKRLNFRPLYPGHVATRTRSRPARSRWRTAPTKPRAAKSAETTSHWPMPCSRITTPPRLDGPARRAPARDRDRTRRCRRRAPAADHGACTSLSSLSISARAIYGRIGNDEHRSSHWRRWRRTSRPGAARAVGDPMALGVLSRRGQRAGTEIDGERAGAFGDWRERKWRCSRCRCRDRRRRGAARSRKAASARSTTSSVSGRGTSVSGDRAKPRP